MCKKITKDEAQFLLSNRSLSTNPSTYTYALLRSDNFTVVRMVRVKSNVRVPIMSMMSSADWFLLVLLKYVTEEKLQLWRTMRTVRCSYLHWPICVVPRACLVVAVAKGRRGQTKTRLLAHPANDNAARTSIPDRYPLPRKDVFFLLRIFFSRQFRLPLFVT